MENTKTIKDLLNAIPLSDGDYFVVNQPGAVNLITQEPGDTRRITVAQLVDYVEKRNRVVGQGIISLRELSPYELAKKRWLPLQYQILEIAMYQELFDEMWVGAQDNATAPFFYKCDIDGTRNVNGLYFRNADHRGIFWRGAGANAVFFPSVNALYDGNDVGAFKPDVTRQITTRFKNSYNNDLGSQANMVISPSVGYFDIFHLAGGTNSNHVSFTITLEGNFGIETAGASISVLYVISY